MISSYLKKRRFFPSLLQRPPNPGLDAIVVIPSYFEEALDLTLQSLNQCTSDKITFEVIVVLNHGEGAIESVKAFHHRQLAKHKAYQSQLAYPVHFVEAFELPRKKSGVGLARKIGMDEAAERLNHIDRPDAPIICLDGDSLVSPNYLQRITEHFLTFEKSEAVHCNFEHQMFETDHLLNEAIINYELHLRYYRHAKGFTGHPHILYTIGSCIAVRAWAYAAEGGMPVRKAGEDFYFLNKFLSKKRVEFLSDVYVFPSSRISDRVPFGTGRAMLNAMNGSSTDETYNFQTFIDLKNFLKAAIQTFDTLQKTNGQKCDFHGDFSTGYTAYFEIESMLKRIFKHAPSKESFEKRFFQYFDHFKVMKFVHFARDQYYPNVSLTNACEMMSGKQSDRSNLRSNYDWLAYFRKLDASV